MMDKTKITGIIFIVPLDYNIDNLIVV